MRCDDLRGLIARHDAGAMVLRHVANFAWYTGGGDSRVDHSNPTGVADVVVTADAEYVVTSSVEAPRMRTEQTPDFDVLDQRAQRATDARIRAYGHALPSGAVLDKRAMLVTSPERYGRYANVTVMRGLEQADAETARRMSACREILARTREATRSGRTLAEVFANIQRFYTDAGFPGEWKLHHQGGSTGYVSRELIATASTTQVIEPGMAFAWNPSITGAMTEETFLLTDSGCEVVAGLAVGIAAP